MIKLLTFSLIFILFACGGSSYSSNTQQSQSQSQSQGVQYKTVPEDITLFN